MQEKSISNKKHQQLEDTMTKLNILESDLNESFVLGGGKGGQKVNKSATCVLLKYVKLNIDIRCQKTRSRALNRYYARKKLCEKVETLLLGNQSPKNKKIEKQKKQKARRKRRSSSKPKQTKS